MIFFIGGNLCIVFLVIVFVLVITGGQAIQSIMGPVMVIALIAEVALSIHFLIKKIIKKREKPVVPIVSSILNIFMTYTVLNGLRGYDSNIGGTVLFLITAFVFGGIWMCGIFGQWLMIVLDPDNESLYDPIEYKKHFVIEIIASAIVFFFY